MIARECAMLGVPAVTQCSDINGISRELEEEGLVIGLRGGGEKDLLEAVARMLAIDPAEHLKLRDAYLARVGRLTEFVTKAIRQGARG